MHSSETALITQALQLLGIRRLTLAVHDQCFPSLAYEETGRGSPYSRGAQEFVSFAAALGFNALQCGPQGATPPTDPSPYLGCVFGRSMLSLAPARLNEALECDVIADDALQRLLSKHSPGSCHRMADHRRARSVTAHIMRQVHVWYRKPGSEQERITAGLRSWEAACAGRPSWLDRYAIYEALSAQHGSDDWLRWPPRDRQLCLPGNRNAWNDRAAAIAATHAERIECFKLTHYLLHRQHALLRRDLRALGVAAYGDLQVGMSHPDTWAFRGIFLDGYLLGAPPSRTNPHGQPWGYQVLNPEGFENNGPGMVFFRDRIDHMLADFDGIRIDHPQGIVCPWVYRSDDADPFHAVQHGARLRASPHLRDHPGLARFAIAEHGQLSPDGDCPRYADTWVRELGDEQLDRYALLLDTALQRAADHGRNRDDILCEVLSTWPYPLRRVMTRRGIGRFCITQKTDPGDPADLYRIGNTAARDWVMPGNHDTRPLRLVIQQRWGSRWVNERAAMLARELAPEQRGHDAIYQRITRDPVAFFQAVCAELFLGPAAQVSLFFTDLLGMRTVYNTPGLISAKNWSLRIPRDYRGCYLRRRQRGEALDLRRSLAMALRARARTLGAAALQLAAQLEHLCGDIPDKGETT